MPTVTIYGASDDLVEIEGDIEGCDEYSADGFWVGVIEAPDGGTANVYVDYRHNGCWTVSLGQYEEDYGMPPWPIEYRVDPDKCAYSTLCAVTVPEGSIIRPHMNAA